jgi:hypothetical protein
VLLLELSLALAVNRHRLIRELHSHFISFQSRKIGFDRQLVVLLKDLDIGSPDTPASLAPTGRPASSEPEVFNHAIHLVRHLLQCSEWTPAPSDWPTQSKSTPLLRCLLVSHSTLLSHQ